MTLAELRTYVLHRLTIDSSDSATVTQIDNALKRAHRKVVREHRLIIARGSMDLTADSATSNLPTGWMETITIRNASTVLRPATRQALASMEAYYAITETTTGPQWYAIEPGATPAIRMVPAPSSTSGGALAIDFIKAPTAMSAETDEPEAVPEDFHELLAEIAIEQIALAEEETGLEAAAAQRRQALELGLTAAMNRWGGADQHVPYMRGLAR